MLDGEGLIGELFAVDGLSTSTVASREVTTLNHKVLNDAVEGAALVVKRLAESTDALLSGTKGPEVLSGLGHEIGKKFKDNSAERLIAN